MQPRIRGPASPSLDCIIGSRRRFLGKVYDVIDDKLAAWIGAQPLVDLDRISDSRGDGVPLLRFEGRRERQPKWAAKKRREGAFDTYVREQNAVSIDGLPAVELP